MATAEDIRVALFRAQRKLLNDQIRLDSNPGNLDYQRLVQEDIDTISSLQAQLAAAVQVSSASAGNLVKDDQLATAPNALPQAPNSPQQVLQPDGRIATVPDTTSGTNATPPIDSSTSVVNVDRGLAAPVRTLVQTQATGPYTQGIGIRAEDGTLSTLRRNPETGELYDPGGMPGGVDLATRPGVGADNEDTGTIKNSTKAEIDKVFGSDNIVPQSNILDQYSSYTYTASVYLMSAEAYRTMCNTQQKNLRGSQLLFQSGGAPVAGRNPYFSDDYYIDKITLESVISGQGTRQAHNVNHIRMTVIEPNGITLINNIDRALNAELGLDAKKKNFNAQQYLLVIRFYGYDQAGNLVQANRPNPYGATDPSAVVEKFFPMCITNIRFKVANKLVEYDIEATAPNYNINVGSNRGSIPYNVELSSGTVKDVLSGSPATATVAESGTTTNTNSTTAPAAPEKANAAKSVNTTIRQGLMAALNAYQNELVQRGTYQYPDTYSVEFANPSIANASIVTEGANKKSKPMINPTTAAAALDPNKQSMDNSARTVSIVAGTQVVQALELILRNSSYMTDQAAVVIDENNQIQKSNSAPARNLAWYKIGTRVTPGQYDYKRNDYAYNLTYVISAYKINQMISDYFLSPTYKGVHKQYNYWFTGENTEVLSYEQNYNALYSAVLSGGPGGQVVNEAIKRNFQPRSGESSQGAAGRVNEIGANAADYLYSPNDLQNVTLQIVGDPAWLQQDEAFCGSRAGFFNFDPFLPDGTINYESQQILFEILINTSNDYDLTTGLIDPNTQSTVFQNGARAPGAARQSYVYLAVSCTSEFVKGKFTQVLKGSLLTYLPDQTFKQNQQNTAALAQSAVNSLSPNRQGSSNSSNLASFLSTPAFLPAAISRGLQQINRQVNDISGVQTARPSAVPTAPTSDGQLIGIVNTALSAPPTLNNLSTITGNPLKVLDPYYGLTPEQIKALGTADPTDPSNRARLGIPQISEIQRAPVINPLSSQTVAGTDDSGDNVVIKTLNQTTQLPQQDQPVDTPVDLNDFFR
jgi:hypothetical protein